MAGSRLFPEDFIREIEDLRNEVRRLSDRDDLRKRLAEAQEEAHEKSKEVEALRKRVAVAIATRDAILEADEPHQTNLRVAELVRQRDEVEDENERLRSLIAEKKKK